MSVSLSEAQFQQLLESIGSSKKGNMTTCSASFNGLKDRETVEAFLTAVGVFKELESIDDADALAGLPLILRDEAAVWWQGSKSSIRTWDQFERALRNTFAPKKPEYLIYLEACGTKQKTGESTDDFVAKKRMLFSELPPDEKLNDKQQLNIIYGLLALSIRDKVPREKINSFEDLLSQSRGVEALLSEKAKNDGKEARSGKVPCASDSSAPSSRYKKTRCNFCKKLGHLIDDCRKRKKVMEDNDQADKAEADTGIKSNIPKLGLACYGCGAPGVYRSNCSTCASKPKENPKNKAGLGFCAVNIQAESRSRPVLFLKVNAIDGQAYIDTGAKISVASRNLYKKLKSKGQTFDTEVATVTLADGLSRRQRVLTFKATVELCGRSFLTPFIVLLESEDNRTLLGINFLQQAGIIMNLAQYTWMFIEDPSKEYELYQEEFVSFDNLEKKQIPARLSPSLPEPSTTAKQAMGTVYKLIPLDIPELPTKICCTERKFLFDGYSPRLEFMMRDAITSVEHAENKLSSQEMTLFGDQPVHRQRRFEKNVTSLGQFGTTEGGESDDIGLCVIDVRSSLDETQTQVLDLMLQEFKDVFESNGKPVKGVEHVIDTGDHLPVAVPPYRMPPQRKEVLKAEINEMIRDGVIVPCTSPWAAPVVLVPKPNGKWRVCIDYRRLNQITVPDTYPIPRIDDLLHEATPTPYMTALDLKAGYWQISVREADQEKTAFITPFGIFKFLRMPFGLRNAPSTFQRLIDKFRVEVGHIKLLAYLDDLIIFSPTFEKHLSDLRDVFMKMREYNFVVNTEKCRFCCTSIKYLGHLITEKGLQVDPEKTAAITSRPPPSNVKHLLSFLQTCSWYRRFIKSFSDIAEPLTRLTKKNVIWTWGSEQAKAYAELKAQLTSPPILSQADQTKGYIIKTDASNYALGAVLVQGEGSEEHPIEYASRLLTKSERNYSTTEREALAVVWAVSKFAGYIEGSAITVVTDHQALQWLMKLKSPAGKLARWALKLQAYDITVKYIPGRANVVADTLSRPPCTEETQAECGLCMVTLDLPARSPAEVRAEQLKDEKLSKILNALETTNDNENGQYWSSKGYLVNNGLLYRHSPDSEEAQLCVPEHEWANILAVYHDDPTAGHYGYEKTYQAISRRYHWAGMRKYIESYVRHCIECQRYKPSNQKPTGLLQTHSLNQRFEVIAFDLFGPLPMSSDGKTWIFIIEDLNSRWIELFALEDASAERCATVLINEIFLRYGLPRRMVSDNGPQFVSAIMQKVAFCLKIKHGFTPVYHPEANPVERRNRDLKTQLAIVLGDNHRDWPQHLPGIRFAMNTAVCKSTSYTPAYITFGRELRTLDDTYNDYRQIVLSENFIPEITPKLLQLAIVLERAKEVNEMEEERRKELADKSRKNRPEYKVGDMVMVTLHPLSHAGKGVSAKFAPRRDGPYQIKKKHGPSSYDIADPAHPDTSLGIYHASALTPYKGNCQDLPPPEKPLRRRGRPRKVPTPPEQNVPTRKRGRPKKS